MSEEFLVKREEDVSQAIETESSRLLPALPTREFVDQPEVIDRFLVRLWPDGQLYFKGSRERIEEFLRLCAEMEIDVQVDHISLCG